MIYKTLKKVSDYCQLLDKSKYPATQTVYGVTFTNNGDGRWTISGKSTSNYSYYNLINNFPLKQGHTYLAPYAVIGTCYVEVKFMNKDYAVQWGKVIYTADENSKVTVGLIALDAFNGADTVLIPQLFDLTEMYGAGHEPATVEEFRSKFPNDLYDYSPHCFINSYKTMLKATDDKIITSYKKSLVCKTKNLFNPLGREDANPTGNWPITKYDVGNVIYRGFAYSGYYQLDEQYKCDVTVSGPVINVLQKLRSYGIGYIVKCNPNTVYTLSFETDFNTSVTLFLDSEGNKLGDSWSRTFTTPNNAYYLLVSFASTTAGTYFIKNLQLELGDTATEYHPYGYL